jgi:predicted nucleic acid-binding Zn ribbon protein
VERVHCSREGREVIQVTRKKAKAVTVWLTVLAAAAALLQEMTLLAAAVEGLFARH